MPLTVARTFYLNSTLPPDAPEARGFGERVKRILPNGERAYYVYKASTPSLHSSLVCTSALLALWLAHSA